jgi:hypothetical protein
MECRQAKQRIPRGQQQECTYKSKQSPLNSRAVLVATGQNDVGTDKCFGVFSAVKAKYFKKQQVMIAE